MELHSRYSMCFFNAFMRSSNTLKRGKVLAIEHEPMQIDAYYLSAEERERRICNHLCMYCGEAGHLRNACPSKPLLAASRPVSPNVDALNSNSCVSMPVVITVHSRQITTSALVDTGATGNFMSADFA